MEFDLIKYVPPVFQIVVLVIVGIIALLALLGRFNERLGKIVFWSSESKTAWHFIEYTLIPLIVFGVILTVIITGWDSSAPFLGASSWWMTTGKKVGVVILGMIPAILCFGALFPLTKLADKQNPEKPLETSYGILYLICLLLAIILLPLGIAGAILLDKYFSAN